MATFEEIRRAAVNLPPEERVQLAEALWESLTDQDLLEMLSLSQTWRDELARRSAEIDAGTAQYVTYEAIVKRARQAADRMR